MRSTAFALLSFVTAALAAPGGPPCCQQNDCPPQLITQCDSYYQPQQEMVEVEVSVEVEENYNKYENYNVPYYQQSQPQYYQQHPECYCQSGEYCPPHCQTVTLSGQATYPIQTISATELYKETSCVEPHCYVQPTQPVCPQQCYPTHQCYCAPQQKQCPCANQPRPVCNQCPFYAAQVQPAQIPVYTVQAQPTLTQPPPQTLTVVYPQSVPTPYCQGPCPQQACTQPQCYEQYSPCCFSESPFIIVNQIDGGFQTITVTNQPSGRVPLITETQVIQPAVATVTPAVVTNTNSVIAVNTVLPFYNFNARWQN